MKYKVLLLLLLFSAKISARKVFMLENDKLNLNISIDKNISYSITTNNKYVLLDSCIISLTLNNGFVLGDNPIISKITRRNINEIISAPLYKNANFSTSYKMLNLKMKNNYGIEFRLYPDGVAYRFYTTFKDSIIILQENAEYNFYKNYDAAITYSSKRKDKYASSFESQYVMEKIDDCKKHNSLAFFPIYINCKEAGKILLSESDVENYPGMFIKSGSKKHSYINEHPTFPIKFNENDYGDKRPEERANFIAKVKGNRTFPWRLIIYGKTDADIANNNMVYQTSSECRISDTSWIKGGLSTWDWWNNTSISNVNFKTGQNTQTYKYYIDFAKKYNIPYVLIDDGWYDIRDKGLLKSVKELNIKEIVDYGKEKGVKVILWAVGYAFESNIENICKHYSNIGVAGFKLDFFERQDQDAIEIIYNIARISAKYKLLIDYHGIYKPTGLSRAYPNVVNYEGVFGLEQLKWTDKTAADMPFNDVVIPFTRGAVGPLDYTQGAMRNASKEDFRAIDHAPMSQGTRAHQVALYVIFDSPFAVLCDSPTNYIKEDETTKYISQIPTVPDKTKVIEGEVGKYVVTLKEKDNSIWIAGITSWDERNINLDFNFLGDGNWRGEAFMDGINADRIAQDYVIKEITVNNKSKMNIKCVSGGGFVIKLVKNKH